ncbi:MAG: thrombospondin type 3 repeat-containing protein [Myxococcales bacterium]|nr:thrombospondin type 3 repeat-containing protein [Myxococcales bacterium]
MRLTVFAAAAGSVVALVGFAGAANASATIDLIWADTGTNQISNVNTSSAITLQVILTAGPNGSAGAAVSVDYSAAVGKLAVLGYASTPSEGNDSPLPVHLVETIDTGSRVEGINSIALIPVGLGTGLMVGQSHQLGTVTFHKSVLLNGIFEIRSDANGADDAVLDLAGNEIQVDTTFNSAFLVNVSEPDFDGDGVADNLDNCSVRVNPDQVDTDADDCGNVCDADYNQSGIVDIGDFGAFTQMFGCYCLLCVECICECELYQHTPPIGPGESVSIADFGFFSQNFGGAPGPSGTTAGTTACP